MAHRASTTAPGRSRGARRPERQLASPGAEHLWSPRPTAWCPCAGVSPLCWRAWTVSRWSWQDDDWLYMDGTHDLGLFAYLFQDYNGHLMPGGFLVSWVVTKVAPLEFWVPVVLVSAASGVLVLVWARTLARLVGEHAVVLAPLALLSLTPLLIRPTVWWASALQALPLQFFLALMIGLAARVDVSPAGGTPGGSRAVPGSAAVLAEVAPRPGPRHRRPRPHGSRRPPRPGCVGAPPVTCGPLHWWPWLTSLFSWPSRPASLRPTPWRSIPRASLSMTAPSSLLVASARCSYARPYSADPGGPCPRTPTPGSTSRPGCRWSSGSLPSPGPSTSRPGSRGLALVGAWLTYLVAAWGLILFSSRFLLSGQATSTTERFHADGFAVSVVLLTLALSGPAGSSSARWAPGTPGDRAPGRVSCLADDQQCLARAAYRHLLRQAVGLRRQRLLRRLRTDVTLETAAPASVLPASGWSMHG